MESNLKYWLALNKINGLGPRSIACIQQHLNCVSELFELSATELAALKLSATIIKQIRKPNWHQVEQELNWAATAYNHILSYQSERYPELLKQIPDPPAILYLKGNSKIISEPQIAIVGSRKASQHGFELAKQFAFELSENGLVVTSGLALGIDAASHQGALASSGKTIAVLGTGVDHIYPRQNQNLAEQILEHGLLISELPPQTTPKASHFPRRNRIISGLSNGVLVVEAAIKSGSLITARLANEQGREVFAIPGSIKHQQSQGCNQLIQTGAKLVQNVDDIFAEFSMFTPIRQKNNSLAETNTCSENLQLDHSFRKILTTIDFSSTPIDVIVARSKQKIESLVHSLLRLEIDGYIQKTPGGYMRMK